MRGFPHELQPSPLASPSASLERLVSDWSSLFPLRPVRSPGLASRTRRAGPRDRGLGADAAGPDDLSCSSTMSAHGLTVVARLCSMTASFSSRVRWCHDAGRSRTAAMTCSWRLDRADASATTVERGRPRELRSRSRTCRGASAVLASPVEVDVAAGCGGFDLTVSAISRCGGV